MSRLTAAAPPGGHRRTSNPGWPRGPPPVGASRRDLPTGCARRSPEWSPGDGGSIPPTSTNLNVVLLDTHILRPPATRGATDRSAAFPRSADCDPGVTPIQAPPKPWWWGFRRRLRSVDKDQRWMGLEDQFDPTPQEPADLIQRDDTDRSCSGS